MALFTIDTSEAPRTSEPRWGHTWSESVTYHAVFEYDSHLIQVVFRDAHLFSLKCGFQLEVQTVLIN